MKNVINRALAAEKKLFTLLLAVMASVGMMHAYDFTANSLYFNKITTVTPNEAEVTYKSKTISHKEQKKRMIRLPCAHDYEQLSFVNA